MSKAKSSFLSYLEEFDGTAGGVAGAFSPTVDANTQMTQNYGPDDEEEDEKKERERTERIHQELIDSLDDDTNQDDSIVVDPDGKMSTGDRILTHLKNLLFREPGYSSFTGEDEPESDHPSPNDHEIFNNGRQLMNMGEPVHNNEYSRMDDPSNPRMYTDTDSTPISDDQDDKEAQHHQLIAAINDLRDELRKSHEKSGAVNVEQEEETEEDQADDTTQFANASKMFQTLVNQKMPRAKIIASFEKQLGVTNSTAVSYYQRLAKQAGLTNSGDRELPTEPQGLGQARGFDDNAALAGGAAPATPPAPESNVTGTEVPNDPNKQGLIRYVKGAHLVYKRQNEEGTYDELWVFGTGGALEDALKVRRNILAGTDIPPRATKSANGQQSYTLKTLGNGQILHIKGLPN